MRSLEVRHLADVAASTRQDKLGGSVTDNINLLAPRSYGVGGVQELRVTSHTVTNVDTEDVRAGVRLGQLAAVAHPGGLPVVRVATNYVAGPTSLATLLTPLP